MKNKLIVVILGIVLLVALSSCVSTADEKSSKTYSAWFLSDSKEYEKLFSLYNSYGGEVCMGISGPYLEDDKDKAIEVATAKCLQYLAFYRGLAVQVNFGSVNDSNLENAVVEYNVIGGTSKERITDAAKDFEIIDIQWLGGKVGAVVFAKLPEMRNVKSVKGSIRNGVSEIKGYYQAIATSEISYTDFADAIEAATFRVAQALIDIHIGTVNVSNNIVITKSNQNSSSYRGDSYSISANKLEGFSVLAYEYDIEENKVYALAVCKR